MLPNMALVIEIRAAEGGDDAKDLVRVQSSIYLKRCERLGLAADIAEDRPGIFVMTISGAGS